MPLTTFKTCLGWWHVIQVMFIAHTSFGALVEQNNRGLRRCHIQVWVWSEKKPWKWSDQTGADRYKSHVRSPSWVLYGTRLWFKQLLLFTPTSSENQSWQSHVPDVASRNILFYHQSRRSDLILLWTWWTKIKLTNCYCKSHPLEYLISQKKGFQRIQRTQECKKDARQALRETSRDSLKVGDFGWRKYRLHEDGEWLGRIIDFFVLKFKNSYFCCFMLLTLEIGAFNELLFIVCHIMFLILANNTVLQTCLGFFCHTW